MSDMQKLINYDEEVWRLFVILDYGYRKKINGAVIFNMFLTIRKKKSFKNYNFMLFMFLCMFIFKFDRDK